MSLTQMVFEGAARAAQMVPLLFALSASTPALAQLPRAPEVPFAGPITPAPGLTLAAHHFDVRIDGFRAQVRTTLTYRNERDTPQSASFAFPFPTLLAQGDLWRTLAEESIEPDTSEASLAGCSGESASDAEFIEAGEPVPTRIEVGSVTVAPGEEIRLETHRTIELTAQATGHRLALPLSVEPGAPYSPQFSADVIAVGHPTIKSLTSTSHGGNVDGIGTPHARLTVAEGRAYASRSFVVDLDIGVAQTTDRLATWGGEARTR